MSYYSHGDIDELNSTIDMMPTRVEDHNETREGTSSDSGYTGIEKLTKCVSDHARN